MKVLFVCRGNVGRSQMAEVIFTKYSGLTADSAGTEVDMPGTTIGDLRKITPLVEPVIKFMKNEGIDITQHIRTQITPEMVEKYDKIIVMAEMETVPEYLLKSEKAEFWKVEDLKGMSDEGYRKVILEIKKRIRRFMKENNLSDKNSISN